MKQIGTEIMSDWPINAYTLREILRDLGFEEDSKTITLIKSEDNNKLLDSYPLTFEDDRMTYGIKPMFITEVDNVIYKDEKSGLNVFNLFRDGYRQTN